MNYELKNYGPIRIRKPDEIIQMSYEDFVGANLGSRTRPKIRVLVQVQIPASLRRHGLTMSAVYGCCKIQASAFIAFVARSIDSAYTLACIAPLS